MDATLVLELDEAVLPGGSFARTAAAGGGYMIAFQPSTGVIPAGGGRLVSVQGTATYRGSGRIEAGCEPTAAVQSLRYSADGSSSLDAAAFQLQFRGDSVGTLSMGSSPFTVTTRRTSECPQGPQLPSEERSQHTVIAGWSADAGPAPWSVAVRRTPTGGHSGTARYQYTGSPEEGLTVRVTKTLSFSFEVEGGGARAQVAPPGPPRPVPSPRTGAGAYGRGQITFTQGGAQAQWSLLGAEVRGAGGMQVVTLTYTPGGQAPPGARLSLSFLQQGGSATLVGILVEGGPAGDATYDAEAGGCSLSLTPGGPGTLQGSGTCTRGFEGAPVTRFTFSASP